MGKSKQPTNALKYLVDTVIALDWAPLLPESCFRAVIEMRVPREFVKAARRASSTYRKQLPFSQPQGHQKLKPSKNLALLPYSFNTSRSLGCACGEGSQNAHFAMYSGP